MMLYHHCLYYKLHCLLFPARHLLEATSNRKRLATSGLEQETMSTPVRYQHLGQRVQANHVLLDFLATYSLDDVSTGLPVMSCIANML